jgi:hypothetical protein
VLPRGQAWHRYCTLTCIAPVVTRDSARFVAERSGKSVIDNHAYAVLDLASAGGQPVVSVVCLLQLAVGSLSFLRVRAHVLLLAFRFGCATRLAAKARGAASKVTQAVPAKLLRLSCSKRVAGSSAAPLRDLQELPAGEFWMQCKQFDKFFNR